MEDLFDKDNLESHAVSDASNTKKIDCSLFPCP